jgi:hypothetical protein
LFSRYSTLPHGGKRNGAGRPVVKLSRTKAALKRVTAEEILSELDEKQTWLDLLSATLTIPGGKETGPIEVPDNRLRADVMKYLTNRRDGMPAQSLKHGGDGDAEPIKVLLIGKGEHAIQ